MLFAIMLFFLFSACQIFFHITDAGSSNGSMHIGFVILTQENEYHDKLYLQKEKEILNQALSISQFRVKIFKSYSLQNNDVGHWTIFTLLEKLSDENLQWIFFLEEITEIDLKKLQNVLKKYNLSQDVFVGYALQDSEPTIIHHFADPSSILYPHFSAGFFISSLLLQKLITKLPVDDEYSFSIDPKYEFARFVWDSSNGIKLLHDNQLCLKKTDEQCATWVEEQFPDCGVPESSDKLHVAVKTCHKFHHDRIPVVKNTWGLKLSNLKIFSDTDDSSIPTIKVGIENVEHGHCEKTLTILKHYVENDIPLHWLALVDDDTIISIERLKKLLTCYNASNTEVLGERYGYGVSYGAGYDYITGGGGMIFSHPVVKLLVQDCHCPSVDSPDDMIIGMCLKRLQIPVIHSLYFHQARPVDYSAEFLKPFKHISFHKHWNINPYSVYHEWLQDSSTTELHNEL